MDNKTKEPTDLENISDDELLKKRICDLPLKVQGTWLEECIIELYTELNDKGISFKPPCYLADEWLTPQGETCIGIPFYLAHPTLIRLEKKFMVEAEGDNKAWCMKLLRHETGHAISHAYRFHKRKKWQKLFGPPAKEYTDTYKYRPYSKNYVRHLDGYYAQYHPDEDFVETFAVWLTPGLDWQSQYKEWKAIEKLKYVDQLMQEIKGKQPLNKKSNKYWRLSTLRLTLANYYKKKRYTLAEDFPDFHDQFLKKVFSEMPDLSDKNAYSAGKLIRQHKSAMVVSIARSSGGKKYIINDLIRAIEKRCFDLKLILSADEKISLLNLTSYCTALIMNYQYTGHFRASKKSEKM